MVHPAHHLSAVLMFLGKADARASFAFEVELDENGRFIANDSAIVTGFDDDDLGRDEIERAAVGEFHVDLAAREEPDMSVGAGFGADERLDVSRPVEAGRIDRSLDTRSACADNVETDSTEFLVLGSGNGSKEGVSSAHGHGLRRRIGRLRRYKKMVRCGVRSWGNSSLVAPRWEQALRTGILVPPPKQ